MPYRLRGGNAREMFRLPVPVDDFFFLAKPDTHVIHGGDHHTHTGRGQAGSLFRTAPRRAVGYSADVPRVPSIACPRVAGDRHPAVIPVTVAQAALDGKRLACTDGGVHRRSRCLPIVLMDE